LVAIFWSRDILPAMFCRGTYNYDDYLYDLKQNLQESHQIARERLVKNKIKNKGNYDLKENPIEIHVKDLILLRDDTSKTKLHSLWLGPFEVIKIISNENILIQRGRRQVIVHKNNVKIYHDNEVN